MRLFGSSLSSSSKQTNKKKNSSRRSLTKLREKKKSFEMMVTSTTTTTEVFVAFAASSSNRTRRRSSLKASTSNRCCRSSSTFSSSQSGGGGWNKKNTKRIETTKTFFACSATPSGSGNEKDDEKNDFNDNNDNNNPFKSVQEIDDYIINPKEITDLIDSDPNVLKEIEKLKAESKKVASEAIEKLKTSNENELRETFKKTTDRVVSAQSEAESAAMDELKIQEERMRRAEENLRKAAEETKRLREEGLEGSGGNEAERRQKKDLDRIESAKAGTISAIGGVLLSLPLALSQFSGNAFNQFADVGATALSCALFGIVYRYAVRENIDDFQLKGGVVGAFGLVRGVGQAEVFMDVASNNGEISFEAFAQAAAICGESVLVFLFAGLCVEAAMTREFVARKSGKE